jgi:hypothetical protein
MKAKEYAEQFRSWIGKRPVSDLYENAPEGRTFDFADGLICVCREMVFEIAEIAESRSSKSDRAVAAIIREQDAKYRAFIRLVPEAEGAEKGFRNFAVNQLPGTAKLLGWS